MDAKQLHILQHAQGLDQYGQGTFYRNRFVTGPDGDDYVHCRELVEQGFMVEHPPRALFGGMSCFCVTDAGREATVEHSLPPPKRTRSQRRYQQYLDQDCGLSFGEWLKRKWIP
jgi:hypothetical protein